VVETKVQDSDSGDDEFVDAARTVIAVRTAALIDLGSSVLDITDPSRAVAMGAAASRLRAAVELYRPALGGNDYRGTRAEIRSLERVIGNRVEVDSAIALVEEVGAEMDDAEASAVGDLIASLDGQRASINRELATIVHGRRLQSLKVRLEGLTGDALELAGEAPVNPPIPEVLPKKAIRTIERRLSDLRKRMPVAIESSDDLADRRAETAAARLRYGLELTGEALGGQAHTARRAARGIQESLFEIRESDVTIPLVVEHEVAITRSDVETVIERSRGIRHLDPVLVQAVPNRAGYRAFGLLRVHLEARRTMKRERLKRLWLEQARQGVWVALEATLSGR
jgi:CHAD domain-containing protein